VKLEYDLYYIKNMSPASTPTSFPYPEDYASEARGAVTFNSIRSEIGLVGPRETRILVRLQQQTIPHC